MKNFSQVHLRQGEAVFIAKKHNHRKCVSRLKGRIAKCVSAETIKLNENENRVMKVLSDTHCAIGAYDIAHRASDENKRLQPVQIYRAVDRLIELGLVHKVKSEGGYIACHADEECSKPMFLICTSCRRVAETEHDAVEGAIRQSVEPTGFVLQQQNVELTGLCPDCS